MILGVPKETFPGERRVALTPKALAAMKSSGELQAITTEWLSKKTNVGEVPVFSSS